MGDQGGEAQGRLCVLPSDALVSVALRNPRWPDGDSAPPRSPANRLEALDMRLSGELERAISLFIGGDLTMASVLADALEGQPDSIRIARRCGLARSLGACLEAGHGDAEEIGRVLVILNEPVSGSSVALDVECKGSRTIVLQQSLAAQSSSVHDRVNQNVGLRLWGAAIVLVELMARNQDRFHGKTCLEIGAGLGLCGLFAADLAKSVVVSDFNDAVLDLAKYNFSLNGLTNVEVGKMDWDCSCYQGKHEEPEAPLCDSCKVSGVFDVIVGADVVCQPSDCVGVARVLKRHLGREAIIVLGSARSRFGVDAFPRTMVDFGFQVEPVSDLSIHVHESDWVGAADGYSAFVVRR